MTSRPRAEIKVLDTEADLIKALNLFRAAMVAYPPFPADGDILSIVEPGRTLGAFIDGNLVGTADSATSSLTLPGGTRVGHAAVTHVGVAPTHTRRGVASALLSHQLRDISDRGEAVASLRASEATIYGRYGYAVAGVTNTVEVLTRRAKLRPEVSGGGPVRLPDADEAWDLLPHIYASNLPDRPGTIDRTPIWWHSRRLQTAAATTPSYVVVHGEPGAETGFVRYRPVDTDGWFVSDQRTVLVDDFFAPTEDAYIGLLRYLVDLDLIDRVIFQMLPVDDPLPWLLTDRRAARITGTRDEAWLRVVDVATTLGKRAYRGDGVVTLRIDDTLLPGNSGTYAISAAGAERVADEPGIEVGPEGLAAAMLGGTTWRSLAVAGLVRVNDPAAVTVADRLFAVPAQPHTGIIF